MPVFHPATCSAFRPLTLHPCPSVHPSIARHFTGHSKCPNRTAALAQCSKLPERVQLPGCRAPTLPRRRSLPRRSCCWLRSYRPRLPRCSGSSWSGSSHRCGTLFFFPEATALCSLLHTSDAPCPLLKALSCCGVLQRLRALPACPVLTSQLEFVSPAMLGHCSLHDADWVESGKTGAHLMVYPEITCLPFDPCILYLQDADRVEPGKAGSPPICSHRLLTHCWRSCALTGRRTGRFWQGGRPLNA
jgi:hypothetical protein